LDDNDWQKLSGFETVEKLWAFDGFSVSAGLVALDGLIVIAKKTQTVGEIRMHIKVLIGLGCSYGPKVTEPTSKAYQYLQKNKPDAFKMMAEAIKFFPLATAGPRLPNDKITLGRLMVLLPHVTASIYIQLYSLGHRRDFLLTDSTFEAAKQVVPAWMLYPGMVVFARSVPEKEAIMRYAVATAGVLPTPVGGRKSDPAKIVDTAYAHRGEYNGATFKLDNARKELDKRWDALNKA